MECTIQSHFKTQLPYLLTVVAVSTLSYVICGFSKNNLLLSWGIGIVALVFTMLLLYYLYPRLKSSNQDMYYENEDEIKKGLMDQQQLDEEFVKSFMYNDSLI